jgi:AcrR family transcriptional regulator
MKDSATRRKLLEATINSIEIYGIEGCTIRNIAKEAGITFSSVHYYYESKEELIGEALNLAISGSFEDMEGIWKNRADDLNALTDILMFLFEGAIRYPGITRAGLHSLLMQDSTDGLFTVKLNAFLAGITLELSQTRSLDRDVLCRKLARAFSAVLFFGIAPKTFHEMPSTDFTDGENRARFIKSLAEGLL